MNLITDKWITAVRKDHSREKIAPWQITDGIGENPIVDIEADRPDFRGALFQFFIGLFQTCSPSVTESEWEDLWYEPPQPEEIKKKLIRFEEVFVFNATGPAFMQDYQLEEGEFKPISALLVEAPGGKTLKDNQDHFIKRGTVEKMCPRCAATALFTLQTNAPSGGVGHRVGLRGGGPLSTLIIPDVSQSSLWEKIWLNIIPEKEAMGIFRCNPEKKSLSGIFPWLAPTRTSESKTGKETLPLDMHPYHMYWGMPRRIRINFSNTSEGHCDLCGELSKELVSEYQTKNYGMNYSGAWVHPLSPHTFDKKAAKPPIPAHGQKGGLSYRNWLGLVFGDKDKNQSNAPVVNYFLEKRVANLDTVSALRLWAFGYDMDNMKARCWYDSTMPVFSVDSDSSIDFYDNVVDMVEAANDMAGNLRKSVKQAWFKRVKDAKGDFSFLDTGFWQSTESTFYEVIEEMLSAVVEDENCLAFRVKWHGKIKNCALELFDRAVLSGTVGSSSMKRIVEARKELEKWATHSKKIKQLLKT